MLERVLITGLIGLLSLAGFEIFTRMQRERATEVNQASGRIVGPRIMYFRSDGCASCATQSQLFKELDNDVQRAIQKVDVDVSPQLAAAYAVMSLPMTLVMDSTGKARYINYGVVNTRKLSSQWAEATR